MTKHALPDLLDLAEAVASGALRAEDAERQVHAAMGPGGAAASADAIADLRDLVGAARAVRAHARATRDAFVVASPDPAAVNASIATMVPGLVRGGAVRRRPSRGGEGRTPRRTWLLVAATLAVGSGLIGATLVGGRLVAPKPVPTTPAMVSNPTALPPTPAPSGTPSAVQPASGLIAYGVGPRLWIANADGTGKHELAPGGCQGMPSWSPDGTRLLFSRIARPAAPSDGNPCGFYTNLGDADTRLYLTDASGSAPQLVDTGCVDPCLSDSHGVFSSDGRRILFVRMIHVDAPPSVGIAGKVVSLQVKVLASMDLATGRVTQQGDLDRPTWTASTGLFVQNVVPRWSPDRTQIVFDREIATGSQDHFTSAVEVFVADADGRNVRMLSSSGEFAAWSPDGTRIVFQGERYAWVGNVIRWFSDIYTIRPDGTDLRRLTTDQISTNPAWSVDGRIWFIRTPMVGGNLKTAGPAQSWIMDADGGNATRSSLGPQPQDLADTARQPTP